MISLRKVDFMLIPVILGQLGYRKFDYNKRASVGFKHRIDGRPVDKAFRAELKKQFEALGFVYPRNQILGWIELLSVDTKWLGLQAESK